MLAVRIRQRSWQVLPLSEEVEVLNLKRKGKLSVYWGAEIYGKDEAFIHEIMKKNSCFLSHLKLQNLQVCSKWLVEMEKAFNLYILRDRPYTHFYQCTNCSFQIIIVVHLLLCLIYINFTTGLYGLPRWCSGESPSQCRRRKRREFNPWVGKTPLEEGMATHPRILAWKNSIEEPGGLQSMGSQRAGHNWVTELMT